MKLIDNASDSWKFMSVQVAIASAAWGSMPESWQAVALSYIGVPQSRIPLLIGALVIVTRIIKQNIERKE